MKSELKQMKITGIIPSRLNSVRFPGKALTGIGGIPMVIRVWKAAVASGMFDSVCIATDSFRIADVCRAYGAVPFMTSSDHKNPTSRVAEVAEKTDSDLYVMIGGDEPLLTSRSIRRFLLRGIRAMQDFPALSAVNAMAPVFSEQEALDSSNIKVVCDKDGNALYASRSLIPTSGYSGRFLCRKFVSIGIYTKASLRFFSSTPPGELEIAENFDLLRFLEHGKTVRFIETDEQTLSVDTPADLDRVIDILNAKETAYMADAYGKMSGSGTKSEFFQEVTDMNSHKTQSSSSAPSLHTEKKYKGILFDLDGTLLDTAEGVLSSVRYTTEALGFEPLTEEVMRTFIGPPVKQSLIRVYGLDDKEADRATEIFRNHYKNEDLLKAIPYPGILDLLRILRAKGFLIGVATLKREDYAITLLEHYGIAPLCDSICGSDFLSKMSKADVIRKSLESLSLSPSEALLIGDTASDGIGAQKAGVDFMAVTYGFGPATDDGWNPYLPVFVADSAEEIKRFLLR